MPKTLRWIIAAALSTGVVAAVGMLVWFMVETQPANRDATQEISFTLEKGTSTSELAQSLEEKGIIKNAKAFTIYVSIKGLRKDLQAGNYDLNPNESTAEIADMLAQGKVAHNVLVVPEGSTIAKVRQLASDKGVNPTDFDNALSQPYSYDFLKARPSGVTSLEGYLYPDTYQIIKPPRAQAVVQDMLDNFARKVSSTDIPKSFAAEGLSFHQGLTLASIVEKEVPNDADRAMVAQVFINRLKAGMPLESDVTVLYGAELLGQPFNVNLNSPYNTYANKGIPPTPICSPSLSSMKAVAHPQANDYIYFIAGKDHKTHYAKTFAEHQQNIEKYMK